MSVNAHQLSDSWRSKARAAGVILIITFVGPIIGILLAAYGVVLAPPWLFLTGILYLALACHAHGAFRTVVAHLENNLTS